MNISANGNSYLNNVNNHPNEINNTTFNYSFLKITDKTLGGLDIDEIKTKLNLLEEHMNNCEKKGKFVEAEMAKQRISQLKKMEEQKIASELKNNFERNKQILELEQKLELDKMNEDFDLKLKEMNGKFTEMEQELDVEFEQKIEAFKQEFSQNFKSKPSAELLNLTKILDSLLKMKNYSEAHNIQTKISQLSQTEKIKWDSIKEKKLQNELNKFKTKHDQDKNALNLKMTQAFNEFKKKRAIEFDTLIQKHKNKLKDIELLYKNELVDLNRLKTNSKVLGTTGINFHSRPISRVGSKFSSSPMSPFNGNAPTDFSPFRLTNSKFSKKK